MVNSDNSSETATPIPDRRVDADEKTNPKGGDIRVYLDTNTEPYHLHAFTLSSNSQYFAAELKKDWREDRRNKVDLKEVDSEDFERYVHYLYTGAIACKGEDVGTEFMVLAKSYALGERLRDTGYKDAVIDALIITEGSNDQKRRYPDTNNGSAPSIDVMNIIWERTAKGSSAREASHGYLRRAS